MSYSIFWEKKKEKQQFVTCRGICPESAKCSVKHVKAVLFLSVVAVFSSSQDLTPMEIGSSVAAHQCSLYCNKHCLSDLYENVSCENVQLC